MARRDYTSPVAEPARGSTQADDPPLVDPGAVERAYRRERARRRARVEHRRETRYAGLRFWAIMWILLVLCVVAGLWIWQEIQITFGL